MIDEKKYLLLKHKIFNILYDKMNDMQRKAVFNTEGPLLILAGAGSGKTTVLVNRIAYMLKYGNAFHSDFVPNNLTESDLVLMEQWANTGIVDEGEFIRILNSFTINPWNILAITFTNKAAKELKERLLHAIGDSASDIYAGTFHSICVRILRREISAIGYDPKFTIYDTDDSTRLIKDCYSEIGVDEKMFSPKQVLGAISKLKDKKIKPDEYLLNTESDHRLNIIAKLFFAYQTRLKRANAVDFDDIICLTVKLFNEIPDVLNHYQNLFKYILVDEYQDTNTIQYELVSLLSQKHKNICVVGDDDQSIYRFRGATIENILSFEGQFDNALVIRLEQNYRSTQNILDAANSIIENNTERKGKNLWTDNGEGDKITLYRGTDENSEANFISGKILDSVANGDKFIDSAILYRTNAQSQNIERHLVASGIPYRIVGGTKFFDRKEIKDMIAYMSVINNKTDIIRIKRIINEPKRGIGDATIKKTEQIALAEQRSLFEIMSESELYENIKKKASSLKGFCDVINHLIEQTQTGSLSELIDTILDITGYEDSLLSAGQEGLNRLENIKELKSNIIGYISNNPDGDLAGFLEEVSLYTDLDKLNDDDDYAVLMTLHSAKGLEFKNVFIIGMEDGIFPGKQNLNNQVELEEERRLAYVGVTRAKQNLYLTTSAQRLIFGMVTRNQPSRFIKEIPTTLIDLIDKTVRKVSSAPAPKLRKIMKEETDSVGISRTEKVIVDFKIGDIVSHKTFGSGKVLNITPMGNDNLVEIQFDKAGTKKVMANFAKIYKAD